MKSLITNSFVSLKNVKIKDGFWSTYQNIAKDKIIPYQWGVINDKIPGVEPSHAIANFKIAAGLEKGEFRGMIFQDSDVAKWLEAVAYSLVVSPDKELEKTADEVIELIEKAQEDDGYLDTYYQLVKPEEKFTNLLECHELYCAGHMIEAAVAYYEATGKDRILKVVCKLADLIDSKIGAEDGKLHGYPGHPELELALVRLYRVTNNEKYLKLAEYMINARGTEPNFFNKELIDRKNARYWGGGTQQSIDLAYFQAHKPLREQTEASGHSVRAGYLYAGAAALAGEIGDESLKKAMEVLWENITLKQMYVTGGVGSQGEGERYTFNYHIPNDTAYNETCAAISVAFFARQMIQMNADRRYADVLEKIIYNGSISGMNLDGEHFFYTNPLTVWEEETKKSAVLRHINSKRPGWFGCACCPPNLARMITSLGGYIYSSDKDTVYTHLYIGSESEFTLENGANVNIKQSGNYPWDGKITFKLSGGKYALALRIPSWARSFRLTVNGSIVTPEIIRGYAYIRREWAENDEVVLDLPMPVEFIEANPLARADVGRVVIQRGPVIFCLESADNGDCLEAIRISDFTGFTAEPDDRLFKGAVKIVGNAKKIPAWSDGELYRRVGEIGEETVKITAVPYAFWGNRDDTREMKVWIRK